MRWFKVNSPDGLSFTWGGDTHLREETTELLTPSGEKLLEVPSEWVYELGLLESRKLTDEVLK